MDGLVKPFSTDPALQVLNVVDWASDLHPETERELKSLRLAVTLAP